MDPQLNRYILLNEGKGLVPGYPKSMVDLIGKTNMAAVHGSDHKLVRGSLISLVGPAAIKDQLFPYIDKFISCFIDNWDGKTLDIQQKTMEVYLIIIVGYNINKLTIFTSGENNHHTNLNLERKEYHNTNIYFLLFIKQKKKKHTLSFTTIHLVGSYITTTYNFPV